MHPQCPLYGHGSAVQSLPFTSSARHLPLTITAGCVRDAVDLAGWNRALTVAAHPDGWCVARDAACDDPGSEGVRRAAVNDPQATLLHP